MSDNDPSPRNVPRVWLLTGHKAGDNSQVVALADALQWPYEVKRFVYRSWELVTNRLAGSTLAGIDSGNSSPLEPPWPDLVITAGRRNEPVARWIREQSGGKTRLVHLGRPWAPLDCFDLIVATPQYFLPSRPNILQIDLPLHGAGNGEYGPVPSDLPKPWWTVLLGGDSGPFVFTVAKAERLARWLNIRVRGEGGGLRVTDSARTPAAVYTAFLAALDCPVEAWHWHAQTGENPYRRWLREADRLVVTGESMSMLAEAAVQERPLFIYDLADGRERPWWSHAHSFRYKPMTHRLATWLAPRRMRRDVGRIQARLIETGRAVWADGDGFPAGGQHDDDRDMAAAVARVRELFSTNP